MYIVYLTYLVLAVFFGRILFKGLLLLKAGKFSVYPGTRFNPSVTLRTLADLFLLRKLFISSPLIWTGEFLLHLCFVVILLRHLRFVLDPVPSFVFALKGTEKIAAFLMAGSIVYIFTVKVILKKVPYVSSYNLKILGLILLLNLTGLTLEYLHRVDLIEIKRFMMGVLTFKPVKVKLDGVFLIHYAGFLGFLIYIPSHIYAAPLTILFTNASEKEKRDAPQKE